MCQTTNLINCKSLNSFLPHGSLNYSSATTPGLIPAFGTSVSIISVSHVLCHLELGKEKDNPVALYKLKHCLQPKGLIVSTRATKDKGLDLKEDLKD